jgi:hypothetical protein
MVPQPPPDSTTVPTEDNPDRFVQVQVTPESKFPPGTYVEEVPKTGPEDKVFIPVVSSKSRT